MVLQKSSLVHRSLVIIPLGMFLFQYLFSRKSAKVHLNVSVTLIRDTGTADLDDRFECSSSTLDILNCQSVHFQDTIYERIALYDTSSV
eukprot:IDg1572t1